MPKMGAIWSPGGGRRKRVNVSICYVTLFSNKFQRLFTKRVFERGCGMDVTFGLSAAHEAGHAIAAEYLGIRVTKIMLDDRQTGQARTEFENHGLCLEHEIIISLAGPLAEEKAFGCCPSVGKESDMDWIKACAWASIDNPGVQPLPAISVQERYSELRQRWETRGGGVPEPLPPKVNDLFDRLVLDNKQAAKRLIEENWQQVEQVANELTQRSILSGDELRRIIAKF